MTQWQRVNSQQRCLICGKPDWCGFVGDAGRPALIRCMRVPNGEPDANGGYLYRDEPQAKPMTTAAPVAPIGYERWKRLQKSYQSQCCVADIQVLADVLGVSAFSLMALGIGRRKHHGVMQWTFPMRDAQERIIGMRTRDGSGKRCVKGSKLGLFIGPHPEHRKWLVVEGESDCAAAVTLGIRGVIGVPGAGQAVRHLRELLQRHRPKSIILFGDNDQAGRLGMERIQKSLGCRPQLRTPVGAKDLRAWINTGASVADIVG